MTQLEKARQYARQAAERAESIVFELLGTPRPVGLLCGLGAVWAKLGDLQRARRNFEAAQAAITGIARENRLELKSAFTTLVKAYAQAGLIEDAVRLARTAPVDEPDDLLLKAAALCEREGQLSHAFVIARQIRDAGMQGEMLHSIATTAADREEGIIGVQAARAIRLHARRAVVLLQLAQRRPADAPALLREALQASRRVADRREHAERLIEIARAHASLKRPQDALALLKEAEVLFRALELYQKARLQIQASTVYIQVGRSAQARALLQRAESARARLAPRLQELLAASLVEGYLDLKAFDRAERALRTVQTLETRARLWLATARALRGAGRQADAERALRFAQQAAARNAWLLQQVAETQIEWGLYDAAGETVKRMHARAPFAEPAKAAVILQLARKREWRRATALIEQVQDSNRRDALRIDLALEAARQQNHSHAQNLLETIQSPAPRFWGYWAMLPDAPNEREACFQGMAPSLGAIGNAVARLTAHIGMAYAYAETGKNELARQHLQAAERSLRGSGDLEFLPLFQRILIAMGWLRLGEARAAQNALQQLAQAEFASGEGYGFLPAAAQFLTEAGGAEIALQAPPPDESLQDRPLTERTMWAYALLRTATTLLRLSPLEPELEIVSNMAGDFVQTLFYRKALDGEIFTLPLFTG